MGFNYFELRFAIFIHDEIIKISGGVNGSINLGLLDSIIEHIKNDNYYPSIEHKLTHLVFAINKNHSFIDGNKRCSIAVSAYFLEINNLGFRVSRFIQELENICIDVAEDRIKKPLLLEIVSSLIYEDDYSEELKLKIMNAKYFKRN